MQNYSFGKSSKMEDNAAVKHRVGGVHRCSASLNQGQILPPMQYGRYYTL